MRVLSWLSSLGQYRKAKEFSFYKFVCRRQRNKTTDMNSGAEQVCSQLCGKNQCKCGASFKGPYCLWNHYRL